MIIRRNAALCVIAILTLATLDGRAQHVVDQLRATEYGQWQIVWSQATQIQP